MSKEQDFQRKETVKNTNPVYGIDLDFGVGINGILAIYQYFTNEEALKTLEAAHRLYGIDTTTNFDFGRTYKGYRIQVQTLDYNAIADLASKVIVKGIEYTNQLKGKKAYQASVDNSLLIASPDFLIPSELLKMYQNPNSVSRVTLDQALSGVGRLADITKAHQLNLRFPANFLD